jgi:Cof subfamily protein (haloacid dehalogenase superfamily)
MFPTSTGQPAPLPDALADLSELEPFALAKLIVLDLDGTLLGHSEDSPTTEAWERRVRLVASLNYYRVPLTVATGRAYAGARRWAEIVSPQKATPFILYNGSAIISGDGTLLAHNAIDEASIRNLSEVVQRTGGSALTYWLRADFSGQLEGEWAVFTGHGPAPEREFNGLTVVTSDQVPPNASCVAALLWAEGGDVRARLHDDVREIEGLSVTTSGPRFIEVRPAGSTKAVGLASLLRNLKIDPSKVMAIGDNDNDVELLAAVGISVCVANASPSAQAVSRFKTTFASSSGAIEALDLVTRARRLWTGHLKHGNRAEPGNGAAGDTDQ